MTLRLNGSSSGHTEIQAPAAAGDNTLTLPTSNGSANQFLMNSGTAGELEFAALAASDMPTGSILQVVSTHVITTSSFSVSANTTTEITDLSVDITPQTSTSDMLIFVMWHGEYSTTNFNVTFGLRRDSTDIGNPAAAGSRHVGMAMIQQGYYAEDNASTPDSCNYNYLDTSKSSGTSQITYKATFRSVSGGTMYNNRTVGDTDDSDYERLTSSITVMEVAA